MTKKVLIFGIILLSINFLFGQTIKGSGISFIRLTSSGNRQAVVVKNTTQDDLRVMVFANLNGNLNSSVIETISAGETMTIKLDIPPTSSLKASDITIQVLR